MREAALGSLVIARGARQEADSFEKDILRAETDLNRLEARLAWRHLTTEQHDALVKALRPFSGSTVNITKLGDAEAGPFADEIIKAFIDSGWVPRVNRVGILTPTYGVRCLVNDSTLSGKVLIEALKTVAGSNIVARPTIGPIPDIIVGLKPPP